jgi:predicted dehydrogenase
VTLRFGVVGTGYWARQVHIPAAIASDRVELVGVFGRDEARLSETCATSGAEPFTCFDELVEQVDAIGFAIAPDAQAEFALTAARAGKHLLLEKPIATRLESARLLDEEVRSRNLAAVVFAAGLLMAPTAQWIDATRRQGPWNYARFENLSSTMEDATNPFFRSEWRRRLGALWDTGPHSLSTLCSVLGRVRTVSAAHGTDDLVVVTLGHDSGATSSLVVGSHASSAGSLWSSIVVGAAGIVSPPSIPDWKAASLTAYGTALTHLADQVEFGAAPHASDIGLGLHVVEILDAAEKSLRAGGTERLD